MVRWGGPRPSRALATHGGSSGAEGAVWAVPTMGIELWGANDDSFAPTISIGGWYCVVWVGFLLSGD